MAIKVNQILGLAILGGVGYVGYVYLTDKPRFCQWMSKLGINLQECAGASPGPGPQPPPGYEPWPQPPHKEPCPPGQIWDGSKCVDRGTQPPPPPGGEPCPPPATGTKPNCSCPSGYYWDGSQCVLESQTPPPPPGGNQCPPPARGTPPNCICPDGYLWDGQQCKQFPIQGTGHCADICRRYRFCSDADVQKWLDAWVKGGLTDADMATILDCWVKVGKCPNCPKDRG